MSKLSMPHIEHHWFVNRLALIATCEPTVSKRYIPWLCLPVRIFVPLGLINLTVFLPGIIVNPASLKHPIDTRFANKLGI